MLERSWSPTTLACIREQEGWTLIIPKSEADAQHLAYTAVFRCITLTVHSSLEAVGLTAALSERLARHRISANMLAGYYHDHILVPETDVTQAFDVLENLAREASDSK